MKRGPTRRYETTAAAGEAVHAFVPSPLPPQPPLDLGGARVRLLEWALLACGRLDGVTALLSDPDLFLYAYVRREAVLSSQIEGTQSSLSDLLLFELEEAPGMPVDDAVEVSNYVAALEHALARLAGGFPLCNRLLRETHERVLAQPLLYLSLYFKQHRHEYYRLMGTVRQDGDWEGWIDFFLDGVACTAQSAVDTAHRLLALFRDDGVQVQSLGRAAANAVRVFDAFRRRPLATIGALAERTGASYPTVSRSVEALERLGIVREITGRKRERVFAYSRYLDTLNEGTEPL